MNRSGDLEEDESNILVAVRVRPLIDKEKRNAEMSIVRVEDNLIVTSAAPDHL
jgi:hypothetical protein